MRALIELRVLFEGGSFSNIKLLKLKCMKFKDFMCVLIFFSNSAKEKDERKSGSYIVIHEGDYRKYFLFPISMPFY